MLKVRIRCYRTWWILSNALLDMRFSEVFDFLYEWLSIFLWVFVIYIFLRKTILYFFTNDYPFLYNWFSSCTFLYKWLFISFWIDFRNAHFCTNDYPFLFVLRHTHTCTNDYPYFFVWVFVIHISVRITIHILLGVSSCTSLYEWLFVPKFFPMRFF